MKKDIAIVTIGHVHVALPMTKALKVLDALKGGLEVRMGWEDTRTWTVEGELEFSLRTLAKGDVFRDKEGNKGDLRTAPTSRRALTRLQPALPYKGGADD